MSTRTVTVTVASLVTIAPADDAAAESRETPEVRALVEASKAGDRDAFGRLVDLNQRVVYRTALAALGCREDAEDVAQDALVLAWTKLPTFRGRSTFRTWLLTIVWRRAMDRRRSVGRWWLRAQASNVDPGVLGDEVPGPEELTIGRDCERQLAAAIRRLSPKLRDALLLAASGEQSYGEIARMLNVPVGTVKWRVSEARRILAAGIGHTRER